MHLVAENWSGPLTVRSGLDGRVTNDGVARYRGLDGRHLATAEASVDGDVLTLDVETEQSRIRIGLAARHRVLADGVAHQADGVPAVEPGFAAVDLALVMEPGQPITVEKLAAPLHVRDRGIGEPGEAARDEIDRAGDFDDVLARHELAWDHLWFRCDVEIDGPVRAPHPAAARLPPAADRVPAQHRPRRRHPRPRLHGEAYRATCSGTRCSSCPS